MRVRQLKISAVSALLVLSVCSGLLVVGGAQPAAALSDDSVKILFTGNSITAGWCAPGVPGGDPNLEFSTWRQPLLLDLAADGYEVDAVGHLGTADYPDTTPGTNGSCYKLQDAEHSATPGKAAYELNAEMPGYLAQFDAPDVAVIMAGIIDVGRGASFEAAIHTEIQGIVNSIHVVNPSAKIFVSHVLETSLYAPSRIATINANIDSQFTGQPLVTVVSAPASYDPYTADLHTVDGLHPNPAGAQIIADNFKTALTSSSIFSGQFSPAKQSTYGVATMGVSQTVNNWNALTWEMAQVGNSVLVGGNFLDIKNNANTIVGNQPYMASFEADTGKWESWWRPAIGGPVFAMEHSPDGGLFVGGEIQTWNGQAVGALVKIDPVTGELWSGWSTQITTVAAGQTEVIRDLQLEDDGWLYVVGAFDTVTVGGTPQARNGAVRINPATGALDAGWDPSVTGGAVWGVSRSKTLNRTYLAGHFASVNGLPTTEGFVSVDDNGDVVDNRDYVPYNDDWCDNGVAGQGRPDCAEMFDVLATPAGDVWVGGLEHALFVLEEGGTVDPARPKYTPPSYMKWFHYSGCDPTLARNNPPNIAVKCNGQNDWSGGDFQELELIGDRVYATCHCWFDLTSSESQILVHANKSQWVGDEGIDYFQSEINAVAAFNAVSGDHIPSFYPLLGGDSGGFGVHQNDSDGCLWVAGGINNYGPPGGVQPLANDVVRLCDAAGPGPTAAPDGVPPVVPDCSFTVSGGDATVTWTIPTGAERVIVERNNNGGGWFIQGGVDAPETSFTQSYPGNTLYRVKARYEADQISATTDCSEDVPATDSECPAVMPLGDIDFGVAARDQASGSGYLLWSSESVHTRFSPSPYSRNADHLIAVQFVGGQWMVDNNMVLTPFTPVATDCLVAAVDFSADTAVTLEGTSAIINGIDSGYAFGDMAVFANQLNGSPNAGEFDVTGTQIGD